MGLTDEVRETCARIAGDARWVSIDLDVLALVEPGPAPQLDPERHYLEGSEADVALYMLVVDAVNFGSGWFPTLLKRPGCSGYFTIAWSLADRFRADGAWNTAQLRSMRTDEIADTLGQRRDHELMALYAQALRSLGSFLGDRGALEAIAAARGSAERLAAQLAVGMALFADRGFYKRAQIVPADLALAGVAAFSDLHRLTIFADNLVPHVLRCDGVLRYDERLAAHIDSERPLRPGPQEREIRACAVHACEQIARREGASAHRSRRSGRAPCTRANCWRSGSAWRRGSSTTGCGTAARRPRSRRGPGIAAGACTTEPRQDAQPPAGLCPRTLRSGRTSPEGGVWWPVVSSSARSRAAIRPARSRMASATGSGRCTQSASGPSGRRPSTRTAWPGLPTTVVLGGTSCRTTLLAPTFAPWPTVTGPRTFAPEPMVTLSWTVGWRLPVAKPVPPRVTPW